MAKNEILRFAENNTGTNLLTQSEYLDDPQRLIGNQPGVARSKLVNKALRQSSLIAAAVAQFIADNQANDVVDTADPADIADWIEAAVRSIGIPTAVAGGTADAITADFTPNVALTNGTTVIVRASAANTTTTPTFAPDGLPAKTIVKGNNLPLAAGDIAGAGHWLELQYDAALDRWVLQNPVVTQASDTRAGIVELATADEAQALASATLALTPARLADAFKGANQSLVVSGYQKLPGGLIIQWGTATINGDTTATITYPIAFPNAALATFATLGSSLDGAYEYGIGISPSTTPKVSALITVVTNQPNISLGCAWMAIGY